MPLFERTEILAAAPALVVSSGSPEDAAARGTVLVLHGLGGRKELHAREAALLARSGLLAVSLDAAGHGERRWPDYDARFTGPGPASATAFAEVVEATAAGLPAVIEALAVRGWARTGRVGLAGVSLGGFVAYAAASGGAPIAAAVAFTGSPAFEWAGAGSPHARAERFFPCALLSVVAGQDETVPPAAARALHAALAPRYAAAPGRLRLVDVPGAGHLLPDAAWQAAWDEATGWFARFLG